VASNDVAVHSMHRPASTACTDSMHQPAPAVLGQCAAADVVSVAYVLNACDQCAQCMWPMHAMQPMRPIRPRACCVLLVAWCWFKRAVTDARQASQ
jgi:hypothetical protein